MEPGNKKGAKPYNKPGFTIVSAGEAKAELMTRALPEDTGAAEMLAAIRKLERKAERVHDGAKRPQD